MQVVQPLQFERYFKSAVPIGVVGAPKNKYEIMIERAVFTQEKFEVYKLYQTKVHGKDEDDGKQGFDRFLCQVPLFDPRD
tara:strand:+ start:211 stop:450 length:240 start_codon:yes stop_codon:yes gene_type:complete